MVLIPTKITASLQPRAHPGPSQDLRWEFRVHIVSRVIAVIHHPLALGDLVVFVVACKDDDGRVIAQSPDDVLGFALDIVVDFFVRRVLEARILELEDSKRSQELTSAHPNMKSCQHKTPSSSQALRWPHERPFRLTDCVLTHRVLPTRRLHHPRLSTCSDSLAPEKCQPDDPIHAAHHELHPAFVPPGLNLREEVVRRYPI